MRLDADNGVLQEADVFVGRNLAEHRPLPYAVVRSAYADVNSAAEADFPEMAKMALMIKIGPVKVKQ